MGWVETGKATETETLALLRKKMSQEKPKQKIAVTHHMLDCCKFNSPGASNIASPTPDSSDG